MSRRIFPLAVIRSCLAYGAVALAQEQVVVKPEETDEILANPGIGGKGNGQSER